MELFNRDGISVPSQRVEELNLRISFVSRMPDPAPDGERYAPPTPARRMVHDATEPGDKVPRYDGPVSPPPAP